MDAQTTLEKHYMDLSERGFFVALGDEGVLCGLYKADVPVETLLSMTLAQAKHVLVTHPDFTSGWTKRGGWSCFMGSTALLAFSAPDEAGFPDPPEDPKSEDESLEDTLRRGSAGLLLRERILRASVDPRITGVWEVGANGPLVAVPFSKFDAPNNPA